MNSKDFPKPLNTFIEEDIPVQKFKFDPDKKKLFSSYEMEKQKVMYVNAPKEKYRCKDGGHLFDPVNPRRGIFACSKCSFARKVFPSTYRYDTVTKQLIHKVTGKVI